MSAVIQKFHCTGRCSGYLTMSTPPIDATKVITWKRMSQPDTALEENGTDQNGPVRNFSNKIMQLITQLILLFV